MNQALVRLKRREEFLRVAGARRKWVAPGLILQARTAGLPARGLLGKGGATGPAAIGEGVTPGIGDPRERRCLLSRQTGRYALGYSAHV